MSLELSSLVVELLGRGTVLLLAGWLATLLLRGRPDWSRGVIRIAAAAVLALPVGLLLLGRWPVEWLPATAAERRAEVPMPAEPHRPTAAIAPQAPTRPDLVVAAEPVTTGPLRPEARPTTGPIAAVPFPTTPQTAPTKASRPPAGAASSPTTGRRQNSAASPMGLLVVIWGVGAGFFLLRIVSRFRQAWRLVGTASLADDAWQTAGARVSKRLRLFRTVPILRSAEVRGPSCAGILRPVVLVPEDWRDAGVDQAREIVLAHELTHVLSRDVLWNTILEATAAIWWFHPLAWSLVRRHRLACELVCDQAASQILDSRQGYRSALAAWALQWRQPLRAGAALPMAAPSELRARLEWLERGRPFARSAWPVRWVLWGLSLAAAFAVLQIQPIRRAAQAAPPGEAPPTQAPSPPAGKPIDIAAEPAAQGPKEKRKTIHVTDEDGKPIAGVEVRVQTEVTRGDTTYAKPMAFTTDERGDAVVDPQPEIEKVFISVKADGFSEFTAQSSVLESQTVQLTRGRTIRVLARDAAGEPLPRAVPLLADSRILGREFKKLPGGVFVSPAIAPDRTLLRTAAVGPDGKLLFSDLVDVDPKGKFADGVVEMTLRPGVWLRGEVDKAVPRPVKGGVVTLYIREDRDHKIAASRRNNWVWEESAWIAPDGTFEFPSLPGGGHAQLHVLVDDFLSRDMTTDELKAYFATHDAGDIKAIEQRSDRNIGSVLVPLSGPEVTATIPCAPAASCRVRVLDPLGRPVEGARVAFNPNGQFLGGELFIPGSEMSSANLIRALENQEDPEKKAAADFQRYRETARRIREFAESAFLQVATDAEGVAMTRGLPAGRESFDVRAAGYQMPLNPLSTPDFTWRGASVNLVSGQTEQVTASLEVDVPTRERAIVVVTEDGETFTGPLKATVTELHTEKDGWHLWSVSRFGALSQPSLDAAGRAVLKFPESVGNAPVDSVRVALEGYSSTGKRRSVRGNIDLPSVSDGKLIVLISVEGTEYPTLRPVARTNEELLPGLTDRLILERLMSSPSLPVLKILLDRAGETDPEPISLLDPSRFGGEKGSPAKSIDLASGRLTVVLAGVRPKGASWTTKPELQQAPEAAYVFDREGKLLARLGGEFSPSGSSENVDVLNLGPREDWFVRVTRFEKNPPFEYRSEFYRLTDRVLPSLRYSHYANSNSWSAGPEERFRHGRLGFAFNGRDLAFDVLGKTVDRVPTLRQITWDANADRFRGAPFQAVEGRELYRVDEKWSKDFEPLTLRPEAGLAIGGPQSYDSWADWEAVVPESKPLGLLLSIPSGDPAFATSVVAALTPGWHSIHLQVKHFPKESKVRIALRIDKQPEQVFERSGQLAEEVDSHPVIHVIEPAKSVMLFSQSLDVKSVKSRIELSITPPAEAK